MILPSVTQSITPPDEPMNPTIVAYKPSDSAGKHIERLYAAVYPASTDVTVVTRSEKNAAQLQEFLKSKGVAAELGRDTNASVKPVVVRNMDSKNGLRDIAALLGEAPDSFGMPKAAAMQVMDYELSRTGTSVTDAGFVAFKEVIIPAKFTKTPNQYLSTTITHPLSAVRSLDEDGEPTAHGAKFFTRMEMSDGRSAVSAIEHLQRSGITVNATRDASGTKDIIALASADKVAEALSPFALIPTSIAAEIANQKEAMKPKFTAREAQRPSGGGHSPG